MHTFYICGFHAILEALTAQTGSIDFIWINEARRDTRTEEVAAKARAAGIKTQYASVDKLNELVGETKHQGVVARCAAQPQRDLRDLLDYLPQVKTTPLLLALDGVLDPHNLGACLRSASAAGVHAVIIPKSRTAPLTDTTYRASAGAAAHMAVFTVSNLARCLEELKNAGLWVVGTSHEAKDDLFHADLTGPLVLVMGGEGDGLRSLTNKLCDYHVRIPMQGQVASLNVSVAAAVCLYEALRQRTKK